MIIFKLRKVLLNTIRLKFKKKVLFVKIIFENLYSCANLFKLLIICQTNKSTDSTKSFSIRILT